MDELHFFEPEPRKKQNFAPCKNDVFCYDGIRPSGPVVFIVQLITSICHAGSCGSARPCGRTAAPSTMGKMALVEMIEGTYGKPYIPSFPLGVCWQ